ncbi:DUF1835 domain-containing protein [uncultured Draconibacterium sp.]|uniref:DUF1835 domain-containing protein n=1 Tax=uncultured Draconibacterium sp. TaxID=1573823 RepID=UPI003217082A
MRKQYHILNGDSLKEQFPEIIQGEIIVARECLVDGNVNGNSLPDLFKVRAEFISNNYDGYKEQDYFEKTVPEFQKIQNIPDNVDINLWFEDDLFCQVNFWFVINLLIKSNHNNQLFLIRPESHSQYGFGGLLKSELISIFESRLKLTELHDLSLLWVCYQTNDTEKLIETSKRLKNLYPFIDIAVEAHIERTPKNGNMGRPSQSLVKIIEELNTAEFGPIFKEFCKREQIYGFGDLQVKRLLDEINNNR